MTITHTSINDLKNNIMNEVITVEQPTMLAALNQSEIDVQIATAHRFPRDIEKAKSRMLQLATMDKDVAYSCMYHLERNGKDEHGQSVKTVIEGLSVRMAEIVASSWGNLRIQSRIIGNDGKMITAQGICHDLESNLAISVEVKRSICGKYGTYSQDMQVVTGNAASAIAFRNALLKVVPQVVIQDVVEQVKEKGLQKINAIGVDKQWKSCVAAFQSYQVNENMLLERMGKTAAEITATDIQTLGGIYTAIKEGTTTVEEVFVLPKKQMAADSAAKKIAEEAKKKAEAAQKK